MTVEAHLCVFTQIRLIDLVIFKQEVRLKFFENKNASYLHRFDKLAKRRKRESSNGKSPALGDRFKVMASEYGRLFNQLSKFDVQFKASDRR